MSETLSVNQIQSSQWEPIYHQEILFPTDQMTQKIFSPGEISVKDLTKANQGTDDQENINYFDQSSKALEIRKKRNPFLYDFFPLEPLIPENKNSGI